MELAAFLLLSALFIFAFGYALGRAAGSTPQVHRHYHFPPEESEPTRQDHWRRSENGDRDSFAAD